MAADRYNTDAPGVGTYRMQSDFGVYSPSDTFNHFEPRMLQTQSMFMGKNSRSESKLLPSSVIEEADGSQGKHSTGSKTGRWRRRSTNSPFKPSGSLEECTTVERISEQKENGYNVYKLMKNSNTVRKRNHEDKSSCNKARNIYNATPDQYINASISGTKN